ncbi:MBL fold metallo-hydrolase [Candidatus Contubernalis alkaliaceticus]|uniref:MBL fold metallo-hydrolase n=1 Tax=Candidatus Contubernalis alkaliaceticus TaxID=338645 RepID=UPI001F4BE42C|nr:MBL fold metallo-hydrolase [Candidatus Contubernalis alkalaceticus]UNC93697.1 MBL fold metallo-hydrolase [Candidatus Contubernalis alkalaceticus]
MILKKLEVGGFMSNCYIVGCSDTKEAVVIDPGSEPEVILATLEEMDLTVKYIIATHGHIDHIGAVKEVREATKAPVIIHEEDAALFENTHENLSMFVGSELILSPAEKIVVEGDTISFGNYNMKVIHTPGHTRGGISLNMDGVVFTGDTLFAASIGRSDLPGGNHRQLISAIKEKLFPLGDDTAVYPGHGPESTIGREKKVNPFLR